MTNSEKIELLKSFGISVKDDGYGYLVEDGWYDIYEKLEGAGFEYVEKEYGDDTIGFRTNGEYKVTVIAANPTVVDIGLLVEYEE